MLIALLVVTLIIAMVAFVTLATVRNLVIRLDGVAAQIDAHTQESESLHKITRRYIGGELIEKRLLPHVGWTAPEKTPFEKKILADWKAEATQAVGGET
jgi:hypothetical protein